MNNNSQGYLNSLNYKKIYEENLAKHSYQANKHKAVPWTNKASKPETQAPAAAPVQKTETEAANEKAAKEDAFNSLYKEAMELYKLGLNGDAEAVKKACGIFKRLNTDNPDNKLLEAYYGCVTSLLGRDLINPNDRFKYAVKGLKLMDHAASEEPDNIEIRNLRAYVCLKLPEMYFHRTKTAVEDFSYLISRYEKDKSTFGQEQYWQTLYDLGNAYKALNQPQEAEAAWNKLLNMKPSQKYLEFIGSAPAGNCDTIPAAEAGTSKKKKPGGSFSSSFQGFYR